MKPKRIFLVRHGESEGNVDYGKYATVPDYQLHLTEKGYHQAVVAGQKLKRVIGEERIKFYVSTFWRTRDTFYGIMESFKELYPNIKDIYREDPRLREQEYGHWREQEVSEKIDEEKKRYGTFYYRIPDGESCADVYDRIGSFLNTIHRDFDKIDYPENVVIVTHGTAIRLFCMRWFHWTPEEFEATKNPHNCQVFILDRQLHSEYFKLRTPFEKREISDLVNYKPYKPILI